MRIRRGLLPTIAALCIATGAVRAQYVEDSIDVGGAWVGSLAYNSREDVVYGASEVGVFFAISCDSNRVVRSFPVHHPSEVVYDSTDNKAYCTQWGESLLVVDGATHVRIKSLPMDGATVPVWDETLDRLYVSCQNTNEVAVVDCATDSVLKHISVGACPIMMYINTLRRKLYVLNCDGGTVSIVDMTTNQVINTVVAGDQTNTGYYSRSVDKFYCEGTYGQYIVIGGQSDTIVARIQLTGNVDIKGATGNEDDGLVYLGAYEGTDNYVAVVSAERDSVLVNTLIGKGSPYGLAYFGQSGLLYCASAGSNQVRVLTGDGARILRTLQVGDCPMVFALAPRHNRLYLGHSNTRYVYVLRDTSAGIAEPQSPRNDFSEALAVTPNPFRRNAGVSWNSSARDGKVLRVYAQDGRLTRQVRIPAGEARWVWDGRGESGALLPPGVYILEAGPGLRAKVVKLK